MSDAVNGGGHTILMLRPLVSVDLVTMVFLVHCILPSILHIHQSGRWNRLPVATMRLTDHYTEQEILPLNRVTRRPYLHYEIHSLMYVASQFEHGKFAFVLLLNREDAAINIYYKMDEGCTVTNAAHILALPIKLIEFPTSNCHTSEPEPTQRSTNR